MCPSAPPPTRHPVLTVQAGLTHGLVGSARLGYALSQVAGFTALAAVGEQARGTCLLGTSKGHLDGGEIRRSDWQEKGERGSSGGSNTPLLEPSIGTTWAGDELTTEASGTSKLVGKQGGGGTVRPCRLLGV